MQQQRHPVAPGQESVWDYPRPPACVRSDRLVTVGIDPAALDPAGRGPAALDPAGRGPAALDRAAVDRAAGNAVAETRGAWRILETSHPPTWYLPPVDVVPGVLSRSHARSTFCEWKGSATYWDVTVGARVLEAAAWSYDRPSPGYEAIAGCLAFSPARLACTVDGERVRAQEGGFYAGWITDDVVGPFKGGPGTLGW